MNNIAPTNPFTIDYCAAEEILDSRGRATLKVELRSSVYNVTASVPSGKSTGTHEALELRNESGSIQPAIININDKIIPEIVGKEFNSPLEIDELLLKIDGTEDKSNLGANATLAISIAVTKLAAALEKKPLWKFIAEQSGTSPGLPKLFMNIINGGSHANFNLPFQEYMIVPQTDSVKKSYAQAQKIISLLGEELQERYGKVMLGDEGGYAPAMTQIETPFELLMSVIKDAKFDIKIAIDAAASEFYEDGKYRIFEELVTPDRLLDLYQKLAWQFPMLGIEDPFEEGDNKRFAVLTESFREKVRPVSISDGNGTPTKTLVVGDDLTVTNPKIIERMAKEKAANAVIIKPNQIGTLKEVYEAARIARENGWKLICSHRSGETMDTFIADLAAGLGAYGIKAGSPLQEERKVKYERLLEIEKEM
ncbi:phosphopyruvate hydratase [Patescibacteria group bacterium]